MSDIVIKAENVGKLYKLGEISTGTISHDLNRWFARIRGKDDPFSKVGEVNDRTSKGQSDYVWALKDVNFEIKRGEAIGIIGRNGAGKSTLLKILSKITTPTKGNIKIKGRIASLLEVGTGFHPELTGRENVFLNGAILGMTKNEIRRKFDEIVDFAGVERYIDTPVKRYSSGMYVRLAFAVAAFLEPEILIVDEVLAVGDAEFQQKCLGRMQDVSKNDGRTVLFVSHNITAVETLCQKGIYLKNGLLHFAGNTKEVIYKYLDDERKNADQLRFDSLENALGNDKIKILAASALNAEDPNAFIDVTTPVNLSFTIVNLSDNPNISVGFDLLNLKGDVIFGSGGMGHYPIGQRITTTCKIPANLLNDDSYNIFFYVHDRNMAALWQMKDLLFFEVKDIERENGYLGKVNGAVRPKLSWELKVQE